MRSTQLALAASIGIPLVSPSFAGTITASSDNRYGAVIYFDGGTQHYLDFAVGEDAPLYQPLPFDDCVVGPAWLACMEANSSYIDLGPGNTIKGLTGSGSLHAQKSAGPGMASAYAHLSFGFTISGLAPGEVQPFSWTGQSTIDHGEVYAKIVGPDTNLVISDPADWNTVVTLPNGSYVMDYLAQAAGLEFPFYNGSVDFSVTLRALPNACSASAGSCYIAHAAAGCNDFACCDQTCVSDPACCTTAWDDACVAAAGESCAPAFLTGEVPNPINGHRYRVVPPMTYDESVAHLAANGYDLVSITSGAEDAWVRHNLLMHVPGLPVYDGRIGLNDIATEGTFLWTSGERASFLRWAPGQPNGGTSEDTVLIRGSDGRWEDVEANRPVIALAETSFGVCGGGGSCFAVHGPGCDDESCCNEICFLDTFCCVIEWDQTCATGATSLCAAAPTGPIVTNPSTGHRYRTLTAGSWLQAEKLARLLGGHLAVIDSAAENEWIRLNILSLPDSPSNAFIGLSDHAVEGTFQWIDRDPSTFTAWAPGEPNNDMGVEDVATIMTNGTWNDIPDTLLRAAIIELPCVGDLDMDAKVTGADLAILLGAWGSVGPIGDISGDGAVDGADLALLLGAWGACPTSNACSPHNTPGSDQPGCTQCVCSIDPFCCASKWDELCVDEAGDECVNACQCGNG
ncbi:MAG: hypothetical protein JNL80_10940 [Phycisphaerae bacterium]|jgi:hypothetical protein|nr:hypothetical protein [Phycisphaerae bacterium]